MTPEHRIAAGHKLFTNGAEKGHVRLDLRTLRLAGVLRWTMEIENRFINGIFWGELSDRPCVIDLAGWMPADNPEGFPHSVLNSAYVTRLGTDCSTDMPFNVYLGPPTGIGVG